jgi:hypothetical protein
VRWEKIQALLVFLFGLCVSAKNQMCLNMRLAFTLSDNAPQLPEGGYPGSLFWFQTFVDKDTNSTHFDKSATLG